jgi:phosphoribosylanthranilate isomerase
MMKLKVCGMKDVKNIKAVLALQPDYMGFIFYQASPRAVGTTFSLENIAFNSTKKIGVFVNEDIHSVKQLIAQHNLDGVQLHGNESADYCESLMGKAEVIKAIAVGTAIDKVALNRYANCVDYYLFDTKSRTHGGSGQTFNWRLLDDIQQPYFLSGGISNTILKNMTLPNNGHLIGLDVNSQYEIAPGLKDIEKLKTLFENNKNGNFRSN